MSRYATPFDYLQLGFRMARLTIESQSVIALRTLGMTGAWNTPFDEGYRMVAEKHGAFLKATATAIDGTRRGRHPVSVTRDALEPLDEAARENRERLAARGRRKGLV
jgi:hypothetical protein